MIKVGDCTYKVTAEDLESGEVERGQCPTPGFYFSDEAERMNGPFKTQEECEIALSQYVESFL